MKIEKNHTLMTANWPLGLYLFSFLFLIGTKEKKRGQRTLTSGGDIGRIVGPTFIANAESFFALGLASCMSAAFHIFTRSCESIDFF